MRLLRSSDRRTSRAQKRVVLHVGAPKTGSTFLQSVLWQNRGVLGNVGVGYPLEDDREHFAATMDLRELTWGGGRDPSWDGAWERVATRIREWTGHTAVFSNELLGGATGAQISRAIQSVRPAEVDVVFTARDLVRQLSSDWQEQVRHTHAVTFDDFVDDLVAHGIDATPPFGPMFWGLHDPVRVLRPWADAVGADHVFVITVPQQGAPRDVLWQRYAGQLGVDPKVCDLEAAASNPSLGAVEAELLRTINERADRIPHRTYRDDIRGRLIVDVLQRRPGRAPIAFPERHLDWVRKRSQELIDGVRDAGYGVVGDLDELEPAPPNLSAVDPGRVDRDTLREAALDSLAGLVTEQPQPHQP